MSHVGRHSSKRPRTDESTTTAGIPPTRDEEFWFPDGNVILLARGVEFRVYSGLLASHSPVFKDMFSLPQPADLPSAPCPVVQMTDSPEDLRHILRVFMPSQDNR